MKWDKKNNKQKIKDSGMIPEEFTDIANEAIEAHINNLEKKVKKERKKIDECLDLLKATSPNETFYINQFN